MSDKIAVSYDAKSRASFISHFDKNGKLKKEKTWFDWQRVYRGCSLQTFDNEPLDGFSIGDTVVGRACNGKEYCSVSDPRGFDVTLEFDNLLYILSKVTCINGKIIGKLVYSWAGPTLRLIPVDSEDYAKMCSYNNKMKQGDVIKAKDFKVGHTYKYRSEGEVVYLGFTPTYDVVYEYKSVHTLDGTKKSGTVAEYHELKIEKGEVYSVRKIYIPGKKKHHFAQRYVLRDGEVVYQIMSKVSFGKLITAELDDSRHPETDNLIDQLNKKNYMSSFSRIEFVPYTRKEFKEALSKHESYMYVWSDTLMKYGIVKRGTLLSLRIEGSMEYNWHMTDSSDLREEAKKRFGDGFKTPRSDFDDCWEMCSKRLTADEVYDMLKPGKYIAYMENGNILEKSMD